MSLPVSTRADASPLLSTKFEQPTGGSSPNKNTSPLVQFTDKPGAKGAGTDKSPGKKASVKKQAPSPKKKSEPVKEAKEEVVEDSEESTGSSYTDSEYSSSGEEEAEGGGRKPKVSPRLRPGSHINHCIRRMGDHEYGRREIEFAERGKSKPANLG